MLKFRATMKIIGVNPYVLVSAPRARQLQAGWRKPMPVCIRINGEPKIPWRINMMPRGDGSFYLYLAQVVRRASHTQVGDRIDVEVEFDEKYRAGPAHRMPDWFGRRLEDNAAALEGWQRLTPSRKKEILRYFATLKSHEAQDRNAQRAARVLAGAAERFMARDWNLREEQPLRGSKRVAGVSQHGSKRK